MLEGLHAEDILLHLINALIFFVIVRYLLYKPVRKFMDKRALRIQASLNEASEAHAEAEQLKGEYEMGMAKAEDEARERALEITSAANISAKSMLETAQDEADEVLKRANAAAQKERSKALEGVQGEVVDMAFQIAEKILAREAKNEDTLALADQAFRAATGTQGGAAL